MDTVSIEEFITAAWFWLEVSITLALLQSELIQLTLENIRNWTYNLLNAP